MTDEKDKLVRSVQNKMAADLINWAHQDDAKVDRTRPSPRKTLEYLRKEAEGMNGSYIAGEAWCCQSCAY